MDLYTDVLPDTERENLAKYLEEAWKEDPSTTLKLIFQLGDPRKGKSDRLNLHQALLWLYDHHFETLLLNLHQVPRFSYYKSMLELMVLVVSGADALDDKCERVYNKERRYIKPLTGSKHFYDERRLATHKNNVEAFFESTQDPEEWPDPSMYDGVYGWVSQDLRDQFIAFMHERDKQVSKDAKLARRQKRRKMRQRAEDLYRSDSKYCRLYDLVADLFAEGLKEERRLMLSGERYFGLVAKWAPTPRGSHDRHTNICEGIIQRLYPECYKYRDFDLRVRFYKEYLSSIRRAAEILESFTGSGDWNLVNYKRMPSRCRTLHGEMFRRHDQERYDAYLNEAKKQAESGERITKISAGALLPNEITKRASRSNGQLNEELGLQWLRLIQDVKDSGQIPNALSICDVSESMTGGSRPPIDVSVALSMLVADCTEGLYANRVITFSKIPELVQLSKAPVDNLASRIHFMRGMQWGYNTDFQKVFDLILTDAQKAKLDFSSMFSILF